MLASRTNNFFFVCYPTQYIQQVELSSGLLDKIPWSLEKVDAVIELRPLDRRVRGPILLSWPSEMLGTTIGVCQGLAKEFWTGAGGCCYMIVLDGDERGTCKFSSNKPNQLKFGIFSTYRSVDLHVFMQWWLSAAALVKGKRPICLRSSKHPQHHAIS